jgi:DNA-binding CsgD family transcriptional regulator
MHSNVLHQLAPDYVASWEAVQDLDPLVHQAIGQPGRPVVLRANDQGLPLAFVAFLRRFGIAQVLCTTSLDTTLQTCLHLPLYRGDHTAGFDQAEADLVAAAMPNLASAVAMNRMRAVERLQSGHSAPRSGAAVTSAKGLIQHADPAFGDFMLSEWPLWRGGLLPTELLPGMGHDTPPLFHGQRITVDTQAHGDLRIVTARSTSRSDRLTPSERAVALQFAQGHSYKEVARTLNMAPSTVRHHLRQVYATLAIQDKGAIAWALAQEQP